MKKKIIILGMALFSLTAFAQDVNTFFTKADAFFKAHVANGKVAYSAIHANQSGLDELIDMASHISVSKTEANTYKAFWINAYNLTVIKGLVAHYPTKSPLDHAGFFDKTTHAIGGKKITLNAIENDLLRAQFKDARFHFVLVCGAKGCPPLISKAYLPKTLNSQMETQTKIAINGAFIKLNTEKKQVKVSQIMKWYKADFTKNGKTEIDFINTYRTKKIPNDFKLSYFPYNWNINKQ